jgi:hypothetical protein
LDDDVFRDEHGRVIGRVLAGSNIAIDVAAVSPDLAKTDEAKLCPAPVPDRPGSDRGKPYDDDRARQYENYVKQFINPSSSHRTYPERLCLCVAEPGAKRRSGHLR